MKNNTNSSPRQFSPCRKALLAVSCWLIFLNCAALDSWSQKEGKFTAQPAYSRKFDFRSGQPRPGSTPVDPATVYTPQKGYGFDFGSTLTAPPFYFSVKLPEGNYNVTVLLGDKNEASTTTIRAECRRLMVEKSVTAKGQYVTRTFTVHVRDSLIHEGVRVKLKPREYTFLHWDDKLTLEFGNTNPKLCTMEITPVTDAVTVFLAGNSTVVDQVQEPWAAWGQMIPSFFVPAKIVIANYAESGETLKAFVNERRLDKIWSMARPGDYLFIEFAHNDQKPGGNYLDPFTTYKEKLSWYIDEARKRGMIPVLVTSMHRRSFDSAGHIINTLGDYPEAMRQMAKEKNTGLIDLNAMSKILYEAWGPESQELKDDTHFNSYGAYELAKCVAKGIKENLPELAKYLADGLLPFDPAHPDPVENWSLPVSPKMSVVNAPPLLETGAKKPMPDEWIDQDTHHKLIRLSRKEGDNASFYFHNNPFIGDKMVFYSTDNKGKQLYTVDLKTLQIQQVTDQSSPMGGEIAARGSRRVFYQVKDSVFATNIDTRETKLLFVFPQGFKGSIATLNADETLLAGVQSGEEAKEILRKYPEKRDYFNRIFEAHIPHTLFTINIRTGELKKIRREDDWIGHVQFSPADPDLLMFCHEGPWQLVDRIWTISMRTKEAKLMHKRTVENEIAGHEFFSPDGKTIWFDWQIPKGKTFYLGGVDIRTGTEKKYRMNRDEWSIHFTISPDQRLFAGDGGDSGQVAKAKDGRWIYLFRPDGDHFVPEKLVNMKVQYYKLEPNVHFSPDGKWVIFRANFEGQSAIYAVELKGMNDMNDLIK